MLVALMALHGTAAVAQPAVPCTAIENDAERLACYDRALRGSASPPGAQAPAASAERAATPPRTETQPPAPTAVAPRRERQARESAAPTAPAAPAAGRTSSEEEIIPIVVVGVRALANRETTFTTDDGATWVQTDSQRLTGLPDAPFDAQIKRGAMGSYFLVATEHGRAIRVRPVR